MSLAIQLQAGWLDLVLYWLCFLDSLGEGFNLSHGFNPSDVMRQHGGAEQFTPWWGQEAEAEHASFSPLSLCLGLQPMGECTPLQDGLYPPQLIIFGNILISVGIPRNAVHLLGHSESSQSSNEE